MGIGRHRGNRALLTGIVALASAAGLPAADNKPTVAASTKTLAELVNAMAAKARLVESRNDASRAFQSFRSAFNLQPDAVTTLDYVTARLFFEAARDAGFWNLHWAITDLPPNSDNIWRQWKSATSPAPLTPTATAECDELSALYAFLVRRAGIRGVGLLWPTANHTVAAWVIPQSPRPVRIVIPTTQIFLAETDLWGTRKFDPWRQKVIYEYTRRDVPDSFEIPKPLFDFFLQQADKYGGASETTLQILRYWREGIFQKRWSAESVVQEGLKLLQRTDWSATPEDLAAVRSFVRDIQREAGRR